MKLFVLGLILAVLLPVAPAANDSVTTGPYKVSFDIGLTRNDYKVTVENPVQSETLRGEKWTSYSINIENNTGIRSILIALQFCEKERISLTPRELEQIFRARIYEMRETRNIESATRKIDGTTGGIVSADYIYLDYTTKCYTVAYYPVFDPSHLLCIITAWYPWDEGTLKLLNSIHIAKVG